MINKHQIMGFFSQSRNTKLLFRYFRHLRNVIADDDKKNASELYFTFRCSIVLSIFVRFVFIVLFVFVLFHSSWLDRSTKIKSRYLFTRVICIFRQHSSIFISFAHPIYYPNIGANAFLRLDNLFLRVSVRFYTELSRTKKPNDKTFIEMKCEYFFLP